MMKMQNFVNLVVGKFKKWDKKDKVGQGEPSPLSHFKGGSYVNY